MIAWLNESEPFPDTCNAWPAQSEAPGLLCAGGELTHERLYQAYSHGIFPWFSEGQPILWWSPDPRMVLPVREFKLSRSLRKTIAKFRQSPGCEIRIDHDFARIMQACANTPREGQHGTWIVPEMQEAYAHWHAQGSVHSVEVWTDGALVGGLYGVSIGRMFFGESMFAWRTDMSKVALAALVCFCRAQGITLIDCQQRTAHLASLGARPCSRDEFEAHLRRVTPLDPPRLWSYDDSLWSLLEARS